mgnify:CR=1 FL=1
MDAAGALTYYDTDGTTGNDGLIKVNRFAAVSNVSSNVVGNMYVLTNDARMILYAEKEKIAGYFDFKEGSDFLTLRNAAGNSTIILDRESGIITATNITATDINVTLIETTVVNTTDITANTIQTGIMNATTATITNAQIWNGTIENITIGDLSLDDATISDADIGNVSITNTTIIHANITNANITSGNITYALYDELIGRDSSSRVEGYYAVFTDIITSNLTT